MLKIAMPNCPACKKHTESAKYCLSCHANYMKNWRKLNPLIGEKKDKALARAQARLYQRRAGIENKPCQNCGEKNSERHHPDYSKPLEIVWLCKKCHRMHHKKSNPPIYQITHLYNPTGIRKNTNAIGIDGAFRGYL